MCVILEMSSTFMRDPNYPDEMRIDKELIVTLTTEGRLVCFATTSID